MRKEKGEPDVTTPALAVAKAPAVSADRERLWALIRDKALKLGDFTLASGMKSSYYIDGKQVTLDPEGLTLVSRLILEEVARLPEQPQAVGGLTIGADPIVSGVVVLSFLEGVTPLGGFIVRKEAKTHGQQDLIAGRLSRGARVIIVDDVITTGGSALQAVEAVRSEPFCAEVLAVYALVDREEGGQKRFEKAGVDFRPLFRIREFGITPPDL